MSGRSTSREMRFNASRKRSVSPFGSRFESWWAHQIAPRQAPGAWAQPRGSGALGLGRRRSAKDDCGKRLHGSDGRRQSRLPQNEVRWPKASV